MLFAFPNPFFGQLGLAGLVSQLREPGVDGAPLLFQAVTTPACFEAAKKVSTRGLTHALDGASMVKRRQ